MSKLYLTVNLDRCWGCKSCKTACKWSHDLKPGDFYPINVFRIERKDEHNNVRCFFAPIMCQQCDDPNCMESCPKKAISRDKEGIVRVDDALCVGCGICSKACPFGAIGYKLSPEGRKKATKCDLCYARRARGFLPSCEQHCIGDALISCREEDLKQILNGYKYYKKTGGVIYYSNILSDLIK